jgi:hypothetical protein
MICEGRGSILTPEPVWIRDTPFQDKYIALLSEHLRCVEICVRGQEDAALIWFDGGLGYLMPMRLTK